MDSGDSSVDSLCGADDVLKLDISNNEENELMTTDQTLCATQGTLF